MRRRILVLILPVVALALVGSTKAQTAGENKDDPAEEAEKREAIEAQNKLIQAIHTGDPAAMAPFYADDFLLTTERFGKGRVLTKDQFLQMHGSKKQRDLRNVHDNVVARVYGNTVVLTGHSTTTLRYEGKISKGPRLFTFVWVKRDGRWQLVAGHVSDIPEGYETQ